MKYVTYSFPFIFLCLLTIYSIKAESNPLDTETKKFSYAMGHQVAKSLEAQMIAEQIDLPTFTAALTDTLEGKNLMMTDEEMRTSFAAMQTKVVQLKKEAAEANMKKGQEFLASNKQVEGVKTTDSGLQYKEIKAGTGAAPKETDTVEVHYEGTLIDGSVFDSSYKRGQPATFGLKQVIKGWTEGLQLMKEGGKTRFFIPAELGYGAIDRPSIPANSVLVFDVELLSIKTQPSQG